MQARLVESIEIADNVRHFVFEADVPRLEFAPGQFVSFTAEIAGKPITRAYSLASAPSGNNRFELCLNRVEDGHLSPHLFGMRPGDAIEMTPPLGTFVLCQPPRDSILIATGTGITPFRSYLQGFFPLNARPVSALPAGTPRFTLLFGVRYESHLLYRAELEDLAQRHSQFEFWPTLTRPTETWSGRTGRVQTHLEAAMAGRRDLDFYLCGMREMVDQVRGMLKEMGFDRKQIRYEKYD